MGERMKKKSVPAKAASRPAKRTATLSASIKSPGPMQDIQVRIAARAYELYVQRGCLEGYHINDWLDAEREILGNAAGSDRSFARI
ncbi:MAG: hypothetical protein K0S45_3233 [Nitrospira sp.]|jgi:hypothetical protein|nr:hypothetical protein [Nitrospira sp.]